MPETETGCHWEDCSHGANCTHATPQHPAAPETETDANGWALSEGLSDLLWHTVIRSDLDDLARRCALEATVEAIVSRCLDAARERVRVVEGERDAAMAETEMALRMHDVQWSRAESAEAAHEAEKAAHERLRDEFDELADDFASNVDWSAGRGNYGDNQAWESAARQVRALLGGGGGR